MRIGIEVQNIFRKRKHASDIITIELLKHLQNTGSKHEFILYAQPNADSGTINFNKNTHVNISGPASAYVWQQQLLPQVIKYHDIDVLHCTNNTAPSKIKLPLIVTIHDVIYLEKRMARHGSWYKRYESLYTQWNMPLIVKKADVVITVSEYERKRLIERLNLEPNKVKTIYHAFAPHFNNDRDKAALESYRMEKELPEKFILVFGNTSPEKNLPNILRALNILYVTNRLNFKIVMPDVDKQCLSRFLHTSLLQHLEPFIYTLGYIPNREMAYVYKLASLFLYPTFHESFGTPILEAMACGTPVITSARPAHTEIAGENPLAIDPKKPFEIAEMVNKVLTDDTLQKKAVSHGLNNAGRFSWQKTAQQIINIYEQFGC